MNLLKKAYLLLCFIAVSIISNSQQAAAVDSIQQALAEAKTVEEKIFWLDNISRTMMNVNPAEADKYGLQLIMMAEESRNRKLMIKAYQGNGIRCGFFRGQKEFANRAIGYFEKALAIAKQERLEEETGACQVLLSDICLSIPDKDKAFKYITEAFSRISTTNNDSLKVEANIGYGKVYEAGNEKIPALRHYFTALRIAEEINGTKENKRKKAELKRNSFLRLSSFYSRIKEYDKAIDNYTFAYQELDNMNDKRVPYQRCIDINAIGNLFAAKKSYDIAISYYERSIAMADSLSFSNLKVPGYISLLNQFLRMNEPKKALDYVNSPRGQALISFLNQFGMSAAVYQTYAAVYSQTNQFDSARIYFEKAIPLFEQRMTENNSVVVYMQAAEFYKKAGEIDKSLAFYTKSKDIGERNGLLEIVQEASKQMDTLYGRKGDYRTAAVFNATYYIYKDSVDKLNKENELDKIAADAEEERLERVKKEEEERKRRRNNIQYMAITIGIVVLFVALVVLGMFKVSAGLIKAIGFFVFLMLFEFVFLVFKKNIYSITKGEPWLDLLFMIGLAALLVPLHHWMEHKVLHYLTSHNRLTAAGHHIKKRFFKKTRNEGE
ncbi:MAG: hypothetical protein HOP10_09485 [Chitinophagaceae bacterium]|nr:hypothetical protein [Chitinophagaceae bacterium]